MGKYSYTVLLSFKTDSLRVSLYLFVSEAWGSDAAFKLGGYALYACENATVGDSVIWHERWRRVKRF